MATVFNRYGTVWIAATLATSAALWYARTDNRSTVYGKDMAHVLAMADVRVQAAYLFGTNAPDTHVTGWVTNVVVTTNATSTVTVAPTSTNNYEVSPDTIVFTDENYDVPQLVYFSHLTSELKSGVFSFSVDGVFAGSVLATYADGLTPPGVYGGEQTFGNLLAEGDRVAVDALGTQPMWLALATPPTEHLVVTTNVIVLAIPDPGYRVDAVMRWKTLYSNTLCRVRDAACLDRYGRETARRIYWTVGDVTNGQWIAERESLEWLDAGGDEWGPAGWTNRTGMATTSWREPGANYLAGVAPTNYPVAADLWPGVPDRDNQGAFGSAHNWWGAVGMGTNAYAWGCELVTGSVVRALNMQVTTNNLNQARNVLTNMVRTVCLMEPSEIEYTNSVHWVRYATYTNGMDLDYGDAAAQIQALEVSSATTNGASSGVMALAYSATDGVRYRYVRSGTPDVWQSGAEYTVETWKFNGCRAAYPCDWACASGMVARVRVYGLFDGGVPIAPSVASIAGGDTTNVVQDAYPLADGLDADTLNVAAYLSGHAKPGTPLTLTTNGFQTVYGNPVAGLRAALVADVSHPTERPRWDIGTEADNTPTNSALYSRVSWVQTVPTISNWHIEGRDWAYEQSVEIRKLVVVVDWNWDLN